MTGYVEFTLVPAGTPIGQGGIVPDRKLGLASVTIVKQPGNSGVYGIPPPGSYTGAVCRFLSVQQLSAASFPSEFNISGEEAGLLPLQTSQLVRSMASWRVVVAAGMA